MSRGVNGVIAIDIETSCGVGCEKECNHALDSNRNNVDLIGAWGLDLDGNVVSATFRDLHEFSSFLDSHQGGIRYVGHGSKFDAKTLRRKGVSLYFDHDTQLMAVASTKKVPEWWLERYEEQRKLKNKEIKGTHRKGSKHSLKTLAPYFLKVQPFWEDPSNHDSEEYVLKDCEYTYKLYSYFTQHHSEDERQFYENKLLPWTRLLLEAEYRGISLDLEELEREDQSARKASEGLKSILDKEWQHAYDTYYDQQAHELNAEYNIKRNQRWANLKHHLRTPERWNKLTHQYEGLKAKAIAKLEPLNLDSPAQLSWLLKDYLHLDISRDDNDEDSTGRSVLERLANKGRDDVKTFLEYRKQRKLTTAFFPTYRDMHFNGILHTNFNPSGTRTGRLSSDSPNLQQVPGHLHKLFKAREGYKLFCVDQAAIEARLIALYTEDPILYDIVVSGKSIHDVNSRIFFSLDCKESEVKAKHPKERAVSKNCGFGFFYGSGWKRFKITALQGGFPLPDRFCKERYGDFKETYKQVFEYKTKTIDPILASGGIINNLLGRPMSIPNPDDVYMKGFNRLIQSSASDLVWHSAMKIQSELNLRGIDGQILLLVHDEVIGEFADTENEEEVMSIVKECMTNYTLSNSLGPIPLEIEGGVSNVWTK